MLNDDLATTSPPKQDAHPHTEGGALLRLALEIVFLIADAGALADIQHAQIGSATAVFQTVLS